MLQQPYEHTEDTVITFPCQLHDLIPGFPQLHVVQPVQVSKGHFCFSVVDGKYKLLDECSFLLAASTNLLLKKYAPQHKD